MKVIFNLNITYNCREGNLDGRGERRTGREGTPYNIQEERRPLIIINGFLKPDMEEEELKGKKKGIIIMEKTKNHYFQRAEWGLTVRYGSQREGRKKKSFDSFERAPRRGSLI